MTLYGYEILDYNFPLLKISLRVGTGTYIRSIAHRLGISCGWDALVTFLMRTSIADYSLCDIAKNPNQIALWDDKEIEYIIL
jgi:tRNA pseudouridine55 synthase